MQEVLAPSPAGVQWWQAGSPETPMSPIPCMPPVLPPAGTGAPCGCSAPSSPSTVSILLGWLWWNHAEARLWACSFVHGIVKNCLEPGWKEGWGKGKLTLSPQINLGRLIHESETQIQLARAAHLSPVIYLLVAQVGLSPPSPCHHQPLSAGAFPMGLEGTNVSQLSPGHSHSPRTAIPPVLGTGTQLGT